MGVPLDQSGQQRRARQVDGLGVAGGDARRRARGIDPIAADADYPAVVRLDAVEHARRTEHDRGALCLLARAASLGERQDVTDHDGNDDEVPHQSSL